MQRYGEGENMSLIKNWQSMWQSYAVWFPTLITFAVLNTEFLLQANLVQDEYLPIIVLVSAFLGRIIKQGGLHDA